MTDEQLFKLGTEYLNVKQVPAGSRYITRADFEAGFKAALNHLENKLQEAESLYTHYDFDEVLNPILSLIRK